MEPEGSETKECLVLAASVDDRTLPGVNRNCRPLPLSLSLSLSLYLYMYTNICIYTCLHVCIYIYVHITFVCLFISVGSR